MVSRLNLGGENLNKEQFDELFKKTKKELDVEMSKKIVKDTDVILESGKDIELSDLFNLAMYESNHFASELIYRLLSEVLVDNPS